MNRLGLLFVLAGLIQSTAAQCTPGPNCQTCAGEICLQCDDHYTQNEAQTTCCSDGCLQDSDGWPLCGVDGVCTYADCNDGYIGPECKRCDTVIDNCDICHEFTLTRDIHCTTCATNYHITPDNQQCCSEGCNDCTSSPEGDNCLTCQQGWYKYNNICDRCGENCVVPSDGSARCDPTSGRCYLGCMDGWHGMRCNVSCGISRCDECNYDEPNTRLTCIDCNPGFYDTDCKSCSANCVRSTDINVCRQDGFCLEGCTPGFRGDRCDIRCDQATGLENCNLCERFNYKCTKCKPGYHGDKCQFECNVNCAPNLVNVVECDLSNGTCNSGCLTQHYKSDCSGECLNCINDICERESGICVQERCKPGFFGPACTLACPVTCANNSVTGQPECEFKNGTCIHGCYYNQHGPYCSKSCSQFCVAVTQTRTDFSPASCVQETGACINACQDNYYLPNCTKTCNAPCVDDKCDINTGTCLACEVDDPGYLCPEGTCERGFFGNLCNLTCEGGTNCANGTCLRYLGDCTACVPYTWGRVCEKSCSNCIDGACMRDSGVCEKGCSVGFYGPQCELACPARCTTCARDSGSCTSCQQGAFGAECESDCSANCFVEDGGSITCLKANGYCSKGRCRPGFRSRTCEGRCSDTCAPNVLDIVECDIDTWECLHNCTRGYYGPLCDGVCSETCLNYNCYAAFNNCVDGCVDSFYGISTCHLPCNEQCVAGVCFDADGECKLGCNDGFYGVQCQYACAETCIDGTCDRLTGVCSECAEADPGPACRTADCVDGSYGTFCNSTCTGGSNCLDRKCDRYTGVCHACVVNRYGPHCQRDCSNCINGLCDQDTGQCEAGCIDRYYGIKCDNACLEKCVVCNQLTGSCEVCEPGTYGTECERNCSTNCVPSPGSGLITCDKSEGACDEAQCISGYFTKTCMSPCSPNCLRADCDFVDGECLYGCNIGWFGAFCLGECNPNCLNANCLDASSSCVEGCVPEYYGVDCNTLCSGTCSNGACADDGYCSNGCDAGWYGKMCTVRCVQTCTDGRCDRESGRCAECGKTSPEPLCPTATCVPGKTGNSCTADCPSNRCLDDVCERYTGNCIACIAGFYGPKCEFECDTCEAGSTCQKLDGKCDAGCVDGYYGDSCQATCQTCIRCAKASGICLQCEDGKHGDDCLQACSANCIPVGGVISCEISSGSCASGLCATGHWGADCSRDCSSTCGLDGNSDTPCNVTTGRCSEDCILGYYGLACETVCQSFCHDETCDRDAGICAECEKPNPGPNCPNAACTVGKYGQMCNLSCSEGCMNRCDRYTAECSVCKNGYWGAKCDSVCAGSNCVTCAKDTGVCNACLAGKFGELCDEECGRCRPFENGTIACVQEGGACVTGECQPGYHTVTCHRQCVDTCKDNEAGVNECEINTGICKDGCDIGYYGLHCENFCNANCRLSDCLDAADNCQRGCVFGYYGAACDTECHENCATGGCNETSGACNDKCVDGFYGPRCNRVCESTCIDGVCDRQTGQCPECTSGVQTARPDYFCRTNECALNRTGLFCDQSCPPNCKDGKCDRYQGTCDACVDGTWGINCTQTCGQCADVACGQADGYCAVCKDGYYGPACTTPCLHEGCQTCGGDGQCTACKPGRHGNSCQEECSEFCDSDPNTCDRFDASCAAGRCVRGFYLASCTSTCFEHCGVSQDGTRPCEIVTGTCEEAECDIMWYGPQCRTPCPVNCVGQTCNRTGDCRQGCKVGTFGAKCQAPCLVTCNDDTCDQVTGECSECDKPDPSPLCKTAECAPYSAGLYCDQSCPPNCKDGKCDRYQSTCDACVDGTWGINCTRICGQCLDVACGQEDGYCAVCKDGYYGPACATPCLHEGCQTCGGDGQCTACKPGRHGNSCQEECSEFCDSDPNTCDRFDASCAAGRCVPGFFLASCTATCFEHCGVSQDGTRPCEIETGTCDEAECDVMWYGPQCRTPCPVNCVGQTCNRTGDCRQGCKVGTFGAKCQAPCLVTCNDDTCDQVTGECSECDKPDPSPLCKTAACPVGLWGRFCNQTCPANCLGGGCERDRGVCTACNDGYYKTRCDGLCPNCADGKCFQADGECVFGCTDGWYTAGCNTQCLHEGCQDCTRDSGECIRCKPGKFGNEDCSGNCSRFCTRNTDQVITCNKLSGSCDEGSCLQGHWGQSCGDTCSPYCSNSACDIDTGACTPCVLGWYGQTCSSECSARCKNKNCVSSADQCREGCADGYWGAACEFDCSANCRRDACDRNTGSCLFGCENDGFWGDSCLEACGVNCVGGTCNTTGHCLNGCEVGWYSAQCRVPCLASSKCIDGTCGRLNGLCPDCLAATPGANCPTADCAKGKRGDNCDLDCTSDNCLYDQCGRYDDECVACPLTFYGTNCQSSCPNCKDGTACNKATGVCLVGCNDGWYGPLCNLQCNDVCASCERNTGLCVTCISGRYGGSCENICSSNCMFTAEGSGIERIYCDKGTGACSEDACKPGFWLPTCTNTCGDNCRVDQNGLKYCALLDGQCTNGCKEKFFGKTCDGVCSTRCQGQLCKDNEDTCTLGCQAGYYGPTCSGVCSSFCAGNGDCDSVSGKCNQGCQSGYYGDRCLDQCISSCLDGTCDVTGICPDCKLEVVGPQCRVQECAVGKYGPICENDCPGAYCNDNKCDRKKGTCSQGCLDNYHGIYCTEQCNCEGAGTSNCDQTTGECLCIATRYGPRCEQQCNDGCVDFVCSKSGSCTNGCKLGRFGSMCASTCIHCKDLDCSATTGSCNQGCNDGWFGEMCDRSCPSNCQTCDQTSGTCTTCKSLYYGPATNCGQVCSGRCAQTNGPRQCDQSTGACLAGCQDGFYGSDCAEACGNCESGTCNSQDGSCSAQGCAAGWFGSQCKQSCNQNCARGGNSNSVRCDPNTGSCSYGCVDGYHGSRCTSVCNSRCLNNRCTGATQCTEGCTMGYYGSGCSSECRNCVQGACNSAGVCQNGCLNGYYGTSCTDACWETCRDNSCDVTSGGCSACLTSPKGDRCRDEDPVAAGQIDKNDLTTGEIVGIAGGCIAIVIIFVVVFVCCIIYMRRAEDAKNEIHLPSDLVERLSTHRSLHSTVSTNYPVARVVGDPEKDFVLF